MYKFYCSFPFKFKKTALKNLSKIENDLSTFSDMFSLYIPKLMDTKYHEYFFTDIYKLEKSDALVIFIPEPSIGTVAELSIFKTKFPFKPAIGINCIEHGWLTRLLDYNVNIDECIEIMKNLILSHN